MILLIVLTTFKNKVIRALPCIIITMQLGDHFIFRRFRILDISYNIKYENLIRKSGHKLLLIKSIFRQ